MGRAFFGFTTAPSLTTVDGTVWQRVATPTSRGISEAPTQYISNVAQRYRLRARLNTAGVFRLYDKS